MSHGETARFKFLRLTSISGVKTHPKGWFGSTNVFTI